VGIKYTLIFALNKNIMKIAKLVYAALLVRVIVEDTASEQDILELAIPKLSEALMDSPHQHIEKIIDDTECPYVEEVDTYEYKFNIKRVGGRFVAFDMFDKKKTYGGIGIKTGKFVGNTVCMLDLYNFREQYLKSN